MVMILRGAIGAGVAMLSSAALSQVAAPVAPAVQAVPVTVVSVQQPSAATNGSLLPSNTDVWLTLDKELTSKGAKVGDTFDLKVSRDVMLGNYIVIPKGTPAKGHISWRTGKGAFGKSAKMEFDLDSLALNGRTIPVAGHYRIEGQGNTGAAVGAVVAVGVFGAFVTGHSATATQGSEWKAATKEPIAIQVAEAAPVSGAAVVEASSPAR